MVFKIHFVVPDGQLVVNGFRGMEEFVRMAHAGCGEPRNLRKTPGVFKHAVGCAAAAVAVAEHIHDGIRHAFFRVPIPDAGQMRGVVFAAVTAALQIAEHFAAVCAAPAENGVGEAVRVVAVDFVRDEIFHAAAPDDLRERPGKAEAVGQENILCFYAEFLFKITVSQKKSFFLSPPVQRTALPHFPAEAHSFFHS